jgi:hypothetical protein
VDNAGRMGGGESSKHLTSNLGHTTLGHRTCPELLRKRGARQLFHHQVVDAVFVTCVMDRNDVRVRQAGRGARLELEPVPQLRVTRRFAPQHLHGDATPEAKIGRSVQQRVNVLAEDGLKAVTAGEKAMRLLGEHNPLLLPRSANRCNGRAARRDRPRPSQN